MEVSPGAEIQLYRGRDPEERFVESEVDKQYKELLAQQVFDSLLPIGSRNNLKDSWHKVSSHRERRWMQLLKFCLV